MKRVTLPQEGKYKYFIFNQKEREEREMPIKCDTDINDPSILGNPIEIKIGSSVVVTDEIAEALKKKYPYLEVEDYVEEKKVVRKILKKVMKKKSKRKK